MGQVRCTVCAKRTIGLEIVLDHLMELLGDVGHVESCFGLLGASVGAQKSFWTHPMVLLRDVGQVESRFGLLGANVGAR